MGFLTDGPVAQAVTSQRVTFDAATTLRPLRLRCRWASELDPTVRLARLRLRERYQD